MEYNFDNLSIEERKTFNALLEKARMPCKTWKPKKGEYFYMIHHSGGVKQLQNFADKFCEHLYTMDNCFKTKEEAEFEEKRREYLAWYKRLSVGSGENENEWNNKNRHYFACKFIDDIEYDHISIDYDDDFKSECTYFPTEEACHNAINIIGEDNFKKYILNIK